MYTLFFFFLIFFSVTDYTSCLSMPRGYGFLIHLFLHCGIRWPGRRIVQLVSVFLFLGNVALLRLLVYLLKAGFGLPVKNFDSFFHLA